MESDRFDLATVGLGILLLNLMLLVGLLRIIARFVELPINTYWTGGVLQTGLAFMTIVGIPYLFKNEADISFLPVLKRITSHTNILLLIRNGILVVFSAAMVWSSYLVYSIAGDRTLPTLQWFQIRWGYTLLGVSFAVLIGYILIDTRDRISKIWGDRDAI
jgi:TRAP-type C4-dicarboxylate transport system permease small subunit